MFVGRQPELSTLLARWHQVQDGRGQVVSIVGEPGMGKTRLLHEFRQTLGGDALAYVQGRCVSYGQASPYLPIIEVVRQRCGIAATDRAETVSTNVYRYLESLEMAAEHTPYLLHLLGLQGHAPELKDVDPRVIRLRTFAALHALLWHAAQQGPLVLEIEDLHWMDPTSDAFLQELVERLAGVPLLVLVTFRPGYRPLWMDKSYATQMALAPLTCDDSRRVVEAVTQRRELPDSLLQGILAKAAGNPFFLEEFARSVDEHDAESSTLSLPDTVRTLLTARIDDCQRALNISYRWQR